MNYIILGIVALSEKLGEVSLYEVSVNALFGIFTKLLLDWLSSVLQTTEASIHITPLWG